MTTSVLIDRDNRLFSDAVNFLFWAHDALSEGHLEGWAQYMRWFRIRCVSLSEAGDAQDAQRVMDAIMGSVL